MISMNYVQKFRFIETEDLFWLNMYHRIAKFEEVTKR